MQITDVVLWDYGFVFSRDTNHKSWVCADIILFCLPTLTKKPVLRDIIQHQTVGRSDHPWFTEQRSSTEGCHVPWGIWVSQQGHLQRHKCFGVYLLHGLPRSSQFWTCGFPSFLTIYIPQKSKFTQYLLNNIPKESWVKCFSSPNTSGVLGVTFVAADSNTTEVNGESFFRHSKSTEENIKCLHTARVVSCKCPQAPTFRYVSKRGHSHHLFCFNEVYPWKLNK